MPLIKAVIFDVDGVLVSTDELHFRAWSAIAEAEGIPFDRATNDRMRGVSRMKSLQILLETATKSHSEDEKSRLADRKNTLFQAAIKTLSPRDIAAGVLPLIAVLREHKCRIAAASSSRNAKSILDRLELSPRFDAIIDGNDVTHAKPDPTLFLKAASAMGVAPEVCVVIEDAAAGIEAARRAGMRTIGVGQPDVLPRCDHVVAAVSDVDAELIVGLAGGQ